MKYAFHAALLGIWGLIVAQIPATESTWVRWEFCSLAILTVLASVVVEAYFNERKDQNAEKIRSRKRPEKS